MLYLIGIGLWDEKDVSLRGIETMKKCDKLYIELYTNKWKGKSNLEKIIGKKIEELSREKVESDFLINEAKSQNVALLIPGDPLSATTHYQLIADAKKQNIKTKIIHSSSILTAIAECGLDLYKFGRITTLVRPSNNFKPTSPYDVIKMNHSVGLHTLVLLDVGEKPLTIKEGLEILKSLDKDRLVKEIVVAAKLGSNEQLIRYGNISDKSVALNNSPGVIIIPGKLNDKEKEFLSYLK